MGALLSIADSRNDSGELCRRIEMQRPEKLNCLNLKMLDEFVAALESAAPQTVVVTAVGRAFCTGIDLKEVEQLKSAKLHLEKLVRIYTWFLRTPAKTVALASGLAIGGGAGLLSCAKLVVASSDLLIKVPTGRLARLASVVLPILDLRAPSQTTGHSWLGCHLGAAEAHRHGLVDILVSPADLKFRAKSTYATELGELHGSARFTAEATVRAACALASFLSNFRE